MNRFFSKLDLRDIKIDPTGSRFPPDAEDYEVEQSDDGAASSEAGLDAKVAAEPVRQPHVPGWATSSPVATTEDESLVPTAYPEVGAVDGAEIDGSIDSDVRQGEVLKVSARSRPSAVAGAIAGVVRESGRAEVQAIGAGATNQAVKAVAIARDYLRETGIEAICLPAFIDVLIDNEDRTAIRLVVEPR
jgi:stage V sporulation protein S